jgi:uncharacterized membrane protein YozB (DUF420 family)
LDSKKKKKEHRIKDSKETPLTAADWLLVRFVGVLVYSLISWLVFCFAGMMVG